MMKPTLIAVALVGCGIDQLPEESTVEQAVKPIIDEGGCPSWGCGTNSPVVDAIDFSDLNVDGLPNEQGFSIIGVEKEDLQHVWQKYKLDIADAELRLADPATGKVKITGAKVIGTRIHLTSTRTGYEYTLSLDTMGTTSMWIGANSPDLNSYGFVWWSDKDKDPHTVCGESTDNDGITPFTALIVESERFSAAKMVQYQDDKTWFSIGCKGHTIAKQILTAHTRTTGGLVGIETTPEQRTIQLKMLVADYCGDGHPLTIPGMRVSWTDGVYDTISTIGADQVEARWTEKGAMCINTPRVDYHPSAETEAVFGIDTILDRVKAQCGAKPTCDKLSAGFQGAGLISGNY